MWVEKRKVREGSEKAVRMIRDGSLRALEKIRRMNGGGGWRYGENNSGAENCKESEGDVSYCDSTVDKIREEIEIQVALRNAKEIETLKNEYLQRIQSAEEKAEKAEKATELLKNNFLVKNQKRLGLLDKILMRAELKDQISFQKSFFKLKENSLNSKLGAVQGRCLKVLNKLFNIDIEYEKTRQMVENSPVVGLKSVEIKTYDCFSDDGLQKDVFHEISENLRASQRKLQEIRNLMTFGGRHDNLLTETDEIAQNHPLSTADGAPAQLADSEREVFNYFIQPLNKNNTKEGEEFETHDPKSNPPPTKKSNQPTVNRNTSSEPQPRHLGSESPHFPTLPFKEYRDSSDNQFDIGSQAINGKIFWFYNHGLCPYVIFVSLICSYHSVEWFGLVEYIGSILISFESKCLADQNRSME